MGLFRFRVDAWRCAADQVREADRAGGAFGLSSVVRAVAASWRMVR